MLKALAEQEKAAKLPTILAKDPTHVASYPYDIQHSGDLVMQEGDPIVQMEELADGWAKGAQWSTCYFRS